MRESSHWTDAVPTGLVLTLAALDVLLIVLMIDPAVLLVAAPLVAVSGLVYWFSSL